ncbi:hypothetical protein [Rhodococcus daqingensis]|uniref:Uncharacterized protein n=1 Tax=Rhodococcus daqingensis TaxID=2479363 RepID=A0ABW2RSR4_9NOCA
MSEEPTVLMTVVARDDPPNLTEAAEQLGLGLDALVEGFGVVPVEPARGIYCVEVRADRIPRDFGGRALGTGPHSNPPIEPMGPIPGGANDDATEDDATE